MSHECYRSLQESHYGRMKEQKLLALDLDQRNYVVYQTGELLLLAFMVTGATSSYNIAIKVSALDSSMLKEGKPHLQHP